jgi:hypothetical protein
VAEARPAPARHPRRLHYIRNPIIPAAPDGISLAQASQDVRAIQAVLARDFPEPLKDSGRPASAGALQLGLPSGVGLGRIEPHDDQRHVVGRPGIVGLREQLPSGGFRYGLRLERGRDR